MGMQLVQLIASVVHCARPPALDAPSAEAAAIHGDAEQLY